MPPSHASSKQWCNSVEQLHVLGHVQAVVEHTPLKEHHVEPVQQTLHSVFSALLRVLICGSAESWRGRAAAVQGRMDTDSG